MVYEAVRLLAEGETNRIVFAAGEQIVNVDIDEGLATVSYTHLAVYKRQELRKQTAAPILFLSSAADNMSVIMAVRCV